MDTVLDFSLTKSATHLPLSAAATNSMNLNPSINLNMENLNLSALGTLLLKSAAVAPASTTATSIETVTPIGWPKSQAQHQQQQSSNTASLLHQLSAVLSSGCVSDGNLANSDCNLLLSAFANLSTPVNSAVFALLTQQQQQLLLQQQPTTNVFNVLAQSIAQAKKFSINSSSCSLAQSIYTSPRKQHVERAINRVLTKPSAKRPKYLDRSLSPTEYTAENDTVKIEDSEKNFFFRSNSSPIHFSTSSDQDAAIDTALPNLPQVESQENVNQMGHSDCKNKKKAQLETSSSLSCLDIGADVTLSTPPPPQLSYSATIHATAAPSCSSSLASSCVSSTQNSPSSTSLRRHSSASTTTSVVSSVKNNGTPQRRAAAPIPDSLKDDAYYERRKKNNDAAKRSRDQRRRKEEETAQRATHLEQENTKLRAQVRSLQTEIKKLHALILSNGTTKGTTNWGLQKEVTDEEINNIKNGCASLKSAFSPLLKRSTATSAPEKHSWNNTFSTANKSAAELFNLAGNEFEDSDQGSASYDTNNNFNLVGDSNTKNNKEINECSQSVKVNKEDDSQPLLKLALFDSAFADDNDN